MIFGVLVGIILAIAGLPIPLPDPEALAQFDRLQRHIGRDVVLVDIAGTVIEGRILAATNSTVDLGFGQHRRAFPADAIARVDRQHDSAIDGLVKGVIVGALLGSFSRDAKWILRSAAAYGGLGFALDAGHQAREPIYRAPDPKTVKIAATIRW